MRFHYRRRLLFILRTQDTVFKQFATNIRKSNNAGRNSAGHGFGQQRFLRFHPLGPLSVFLPQKCLAGSGANLKSSCVSASFAEVSGRCAEVDGRLFLSLSKDIIQKNELMMPATVMPIVSVSVIVRSIGAGSGVVRTVRIMIMACIGAGSRVMSIAVAVSVIVRSIRADSGVVRIVMTGAAVMRSVVVCSCMTGVGTGAVRSVGKYVAVFVIADDALLRYICCVGIDVGITERCCTEFNVLFLCGRIEGFVCEDAFVAA
jgi:hypothetical protein